MYGLFVNYLNIQSAVNVLDKYLVRKLGNTRSDTIFKLEMKMDYLQIPCVICNNCSIGHKYHFMCIDYKSFFLKSSCSFKPKKNTKSL